MTEFRPGRFQILPLIVKNLLIINGLFFLAQITLDKGGPFPKFPMNDLLALHAWQSELFQPWQLITHMFMHSTSDYMHIFGNMFALWMFGSILENVWGAKRFLIFYLVCGLGAALIHLLSLNYELGPLMRDYNLIAQHASDPTSFANSAISFGKKYGLMYANNSEFISYLRANPNDPVLVNRLLDAITTFKNTRVNGITVGASGAVFGILAAFVYLFPNTYIYLYFFVPIKAKWLGLLYFGYEIFYAIQNSAGDNVARWAHIGGGVVGLLIVITWNKTNKKTLY